MHEVFTPRAIREAIITLRTALLTDETLYDAFRASIYSQLKEAPMDMHLSDVARLVLDRIIGVENDRAR